MAVIKKLNSQEKIEHINNIINAHEGSLCPFCFHPIEKYTDKAGKGKEACYNHDGGDITVEMKDYYNAIYNIVRFGEMRKIIKYKSIIDF